MDYVKLDCDTKTFINRMTMTGSKVEAVHKQAADISGVVVGKVVSIEKHTNADTLFVTKIDIGDKIIQIVTGAKNLYEGAVVPVALDGAVLAGNLEIKSGALRGELSDGMLCSVEELGFTRNDYPEAPENGIYIFPSSDIPLGVDAVESLGMREEVIEFEITSNRSDCFSVVGLAREAAATFNTTLTLPPNNVGADVSVCPSADDIKNYITVKIENPDLCPRYIARVVKNAKIEASPLWLRKRLTAAGIRPINNIVDITNFVMHELGQPMHAFDISNVSGGGIIVRNATNGEQFTTLDGIKRILDPSMLVISDETKAVAIAGVMGGENSMVTEGANTILFESANFNGTNIRLTSKKLGLRTDSSGKFEKGLDPNLAETAINRAMHLVELLGCGEVVKGLADCYPEPRKPWTVCYKPENINKLLGTKISEEMIEKLLGSVEIEAKSGVAKIPTFRPDVTQEADLTEEVARLFGYDLIEGTLAAGTPTVGKKTTCQTYCDSIKTTMVSQGFYEALTYGFESPKVFNKLNIPDNSTLRQTVTINNPLGEDYSVMRTTTLNSMLSALSTNYNRRNESAFLFELGKEYLPKSLPLTDLPNELNVLTIGAYGDFDFYGLKGIVEELFETLGLPEADYVPTKDFSPLHPGRTASIELKGENIGIMGEVHPLVSENYELGAKAYIAVISLDDSFKHAETTRIYAPVPKFPAIKRDIAVVVKDEFLVKQLELAIRSSGGNFIESVRLFDVYKGQGVETGHKSVAFNIVFRAPDRTLIDADVTTAFNNITNQLEKQFNAKIRS